MSLALARKYRPKNFASVAVQSHVSNTLKGAIARGRVAHGYLLCGPRGTGKTTLARVLAMALNCERRADDGEPCGECTSCSRIWTGGASLDVVEIDAASNRGVDDARDLRERAMYAPSGDDRHKVYIVDEAHMLTREAWNALLKVLEEPPPRVVFVFATTEPQKIAQMAAPVLSRLQRFDLKRIGPAEIRERLAAVLDAEGVPYEPEALAMIARAADGGLRDALSLTDQVLSLGEAGHVTPDRVREALGLVPEEEYLAVLDLVTERRAADVFTAVRRLVDQGVDLGGFVTGLADVLRAQLAVELGGTPPELSENARLALDARRGRLAAGDLLRMMSLLGELEPRFRKSSQQQLLLETLLVRFALLDRTVALEEVLRGLGGAGGDGAAGASRVPPPRTPDPRPAPPAPRREAAPPAGDRIAAPSPQRPSASASAVAPRAAWSGGAGGTALAEPPRAGSAAVAAAAGRAALAFEPEAAPRPAPELGRLVERWSEVVGGLRAAGRGILAAAVDQCRPGSVSGQGVVSVEPDTAATADTIEMGREELGAALRAIFPGVLRVLVRRPDAAPGEAGARRITHEGVRAERIALLRRKDAVLGAAIDELDLELMD